MEDAARAILAVADEAMVDAIREITVNQGVDPRECLLVAGGGAGGFNAATVARELGCRAAWFPGRRPHSVPSARSFRTWWLISV